MPEYVTYQVIERALALMHGANDAAQRGALRARLDHLKRAKALGVNPGKGQRVVYDREAMVWLLIALELEEFGIGAPVIGELFEKDRELLRKLVAKAARDRGKAGDVVLTVQPAFMSAGWRGKSELPGLGEVPGREAMGSFYDWLQSAKPGGVARSAPRACVFNLSARLRALDKALVEAAKTKAETPMSEAAQQIVDMGAVGRGEMTLKEFRAKHKRSK